MLSISRCPCSRSAVWCRTEDMKVLYIFLLCLLTTQAARSWKNKRGNRYAVRETAPDSGYQYQPPATGEEASPNYQSQQTDQQHQSDSQRDNPGDDGYHYDAPLPSSNAMSAAMMAHHEAMQNFDAGMPAHLDNVMSKANENAAYQHEGGGAQAPVGFQDIGNFASHSNAVLGTMSNNPESYGSVGNAAGPGDYDYNAVLNSVNSANFGNSLNLGGSGSSDQFTGVQGEIIDEHPPSVFKYKPHFGGKDINNLPHILPPGGKSVQELQDEADAKLRSIIEKARINQMEVVERIQKLKTNYGFGTLGYDGFKDTRFKTMGKIDLGTHKAIDLGTSIDYNALKGSDGKLKLPIQNIYHTKTLGIHIPKPYPIKQEVAVPAPYPVPHVISAPQHKPKLFSPLSHEDIAHLSADDGRNSYGSFPSFGGNEAFPNSQANLNFGGDFGFEEQTFKGPASPAGSISIQQSHRVSESSTIGGLPYGAGTAGHPIGTHVETSDYSNHGHSLPLSMFGLPAGTVSGALSSYDVPIQGHQQTSQPHTITSEAGQVQIPEMMHDEPDNTENKPHTEYGPPH